MEALRTIDGPFDLASLAVGPLGVIHHYLERLDVHGLLDRRLGGQGSHPRPAAVLGVVLRNLVVAREPLYGVGEWAQEHHPHVLGLSPGEAAVLNDDRIGRALDRLFDADRASLVTELAVRVVREFNVDLSRVHQDTTTATVTGQYRDATGATRRGKPTLRITWGHNKDHRPDLKQIVWSLTATADGMVPIHYRAYDGNTSDVPTHRESWDAVRALTSGADFLYVADSKLCVEDTLAYIASQGGRFLTVLPRTRGEDAAFRKYAQTHALAWQEVERKRNPHRKAGPAHVWKMIESPVPAADGHRLVWVWDSLKQETDREARQDRIDRALKALGDLEARLGNPRTRLRSEAAVASAAEEAIGTAAAWVAYEVRRDVIASYQQTRRGRPGKDTKYRRVERARFHVEPILRHEAISFDAKTDGMFPLLTNTDLQLKKLLAAYKDQPKLEKRHQQLKTVYGVRPILLKKATRIEAFLFLYYVALLVEALIERQVRNAMRQENVEGLAVYPEDRKSASPTTDRVLSLFDRLSVDYLTKDRALVQTFPPRLSDKHHRLLELADVPARTYEGLT